MQEEEETICPADADAAVVLVSLLCERFNQTEKRRDPRVDKFMSQSRDLSGRLREREVGWTDGAKRVALHQPPTVFPDPLYLYLFYPLTSFCRSHLTPICAPFAATKQADRDIRSPF